MCDGALRGFILFICSLWHYWPYVFFFCILYFVSCILHLVSSVLLCRTRGYNLQLSRSLSCFKSCYAVLFCFTCWLVRFLFLLILQPSIHDQIVLFNTTLHPYCFLSMNTNTITYFELISDQIKTCCLHSLLYISVGERVMIYILHYIHFVSLLIFYFILFVCLFFISCRSKYCTQTGLVIARMDHYCVWLGNSVGFRNHRIFILFLITQLAATTMYSAMLIR